MTNYGFANGDISKGLITQDAAKAGRAFFKPKNPKMLKGFDNSWEGANGPEKLKRGRTLRPARVAAVAGGAAAGTAGIGGAGFLAGRKSK